MATVIMVTVTRLEVVRLLRLPGDCRALVPREVTELGERMGELRRLDRPQDPARPPLRVRPVPPRQGFS